MTPTRQIKSLYIRLLVPFLGLFAFSIITVSGLLHLSTSGQDRNAIETSVHLAEAALETAQRELANITFETAYWDQAVDKLVTNYDMEWAASNLGSYLQENYGVSGSYLFDADGRAVFGAFNGEISSVDPFKRYSGGLDILIKEAMTSDPHSVPVPATGILYDPEIAYSATAVRLTTYFQKGGEEIVQATDSVIVFLKAIDQGLLSDLADRHLLPKLRVLRSGTPEHDAFLPLITADGDQIGFLVWDPDLPGAKILSQLLWGLAGVLVIVSGFAFVFRNRAREITSALTDASRQLNQQSEVLQATLDSIDQGIAAWDADGRLVAWNEQVEDFWYHPPNLQVGMTRLQLLEHIASTGALGHGDAKDLAHDQHREVVAAGTNSTDMIKMLDGRDISFFRFGMENGGHTTVYSDVTELLKHERELNEAKEQAEAGNRAKSEFIAHVSHELRTPLNAIIGFSEMMMQKIFGPLGNEKYDEYADVINSAGRHLLDQINQVLDLSKIDAGKITLEFEDVNIEEITEYVASLVEPQLKARAHSLKIDIPKDFPMLHADKTVMTQVLMNLLSNAIKFTPEKGLIEVTAKVEDDKILIIVDDNGIGIEEDMLNKVIDPFVQIRSALTRSEQGTGLGLSIVASLIEHHGGDINLDSEIHKGTTVTVTFPASRTVWPR